MTSNLSTYFWFHTILLQYLLWSFGVVWCLFFFFLVNIPKSYFWRIETEVRKTFKVGNYLSNQAGWTEKEVQIIKWISKWHNQILRIRLTHNSATWILLHVCRAGYQKPPLPVLCQIIWTILQYNQDLCTEKWMCLVHVWS